MQDVIHSKITAAVIPGHPSWCIGGDHDALVESDVFGEEPEHFALVANGIGWSVDLTKSVRGGAAYVTVHHGDYELSADPSRARSLGAALIRAADLAERDGCA